MVLCHHIFDGRVVEHNKICGNGKTEYVKIGRGIFRHNEVVTGLGLD
jgi:hypothetical protein